MSEYRVKGVVGKDGISVMTEWRDAPRGVMVGISIGLEAQGWRHTEIEERDPDDR